MVLRYHYFILYPVMRYESTRFESFCPLCPCRSCVVERTSGMRTRDVFRGSSQTSDFRRLAPETVAIDNQECLFSALQMAYHLLANHNQGH
jgi:hypothetical protein